MKNEENRILREVLFEFVSVTCKSVSYGLLAKIYKSQCLGYNLEPISQLHREHLHTPQLTRHRIRMSIRNRILRYQKSES